MKSFDKCPICSGELAEKEVEKLLRGGNNTAVLNVVVEVCLNCGERLYTEEQVRKFEEIRSKLAKNETRMYQRLGASFQVSI